MTFPTCPNEYHQFRQVCYKLFLIPKSFTNSAEICQAGGGTLAMPRDAGINAFLLNLIAMHHPNNFWIGLDDQRNEGQWTWIDGTALGAGYAAWAPGEPNDMDGRQDCAYYWGARDYQWDDGQCNVFHRFSFICQVLLSALSQPTTEIPTTTRRETTSPSSTTVRTTQATSTQSQVSSTPRLTQLSTLPEITVYQHPTTQSAAQPTLPGTSVSQHPTTDQMTHQSTLPGTTTVSEHPTTDQTTHRSTLPGTTTVSEHPTTDQTTLPGTTVSQSTTKQITQPSTLPGTTQHTTNQTTKLADANEDDKWLNIHRTEMNKTQFYHKANPMSVRATRGKQAEHLITPWLSSLCYTSSRPEVNDPHPKSGLVGGNFGAAGRQERD
ncbi:hypothetical protein Bbelb_125860 [Branchiostoma belcheri]|nr:hypothetical protein Bbelb_125860 [Branchiostoma belcheri]